MPVRKRIDIGRTGGAGVVPPLAESRIRRDGNSAIGVSPLPAPQSQWTEVRRHTHAGTSLKREQLWQSINFPKIFLNR
jgi:hypothetical protein